MAPNSKGFYQSSGFEGDVGREDNTVPGPDDSLVAEAASWRIQANRRCRFTDVVLFVLAGLAKLGIVVTVVVGRANDDALADLQVTDVRANLDDGAGELVAHDDGQSGAGMGIHVPFLRRKYRAADVFGYIGSTDAAIRDLDADMVGPARPSKQEGELVKFFIARRGITSNVSLYYVLGLELLQADIATLVEAEGGHGWPSRRLLKQSGSRHVVQQVRC